MSEIDELFKIAINSTRNKKKKFTLSIGTVKEIQEDTCTVDDYEDVRLNAIIQNISSQFTIYPKVGSKVIIGKLENESDLFVVRVSEIEKVTIKINDQLFQMKDGKFTIKTGNISLKSILNDGFSQLQNAVILTVSGGNGNFSPADIAVFQSLNNKVNQILE